MTQTITVKMDKDSEYYFVDASATDQGAVDASYDSAKDLIDAIGTSKSATLVFSHSGGGNTTTYTFSTSETIPANIQVIVECGARITIATGITVTIGNFSDPGLAHVFACAGTGIPVFSIGAVGWVRPEWFGAVAESAGGGTADHTYINQAIKSAQNTKKVELAAGYYDVAADIDVDYTEMYIKGAGRTNTTLYVSIADVASFTNGVIDLGSGEPSALLEDFGIEFEQTDTAVKASITAYKPAISAVAEPRFHINRMRITKAYDGIDMTGNSGGAVIKDLEMSMFNLGIEINGSEDEVYISGLRVWPFDMTANQDDIFYVLGTTLGTCGINVKRCDGLVISDSMFINGQAIDFDSGGASNSFSRLTNVNFDTYAQIDIDANHRIQFDNCFFSTAANGFKAFDITDGRITIRGSHFVCGTTDASIIYFAAGDANYDNLLTVTGCTIETGNQDESAIECTATTVLLVVISNNILIKYKISATDTQSSIHNITYNNSLTISG